MIELLRRQQRRRRRNEIPLNIILLKQLNMASLIGKVWLTFLHFSSHLSLPFSLASPPLPPRCRELVEKEGVDITKGDKENITVLHWAAINNRIPVVSYFLQKGANVNAIGGELKSPPVHWATR